MKPPSLSWALAAFIVIGYQQQAHCLFTPPSKHNFTPIEEEPAEEKRLPLNSRLEIGGNYTYLTLHPDNHQTLKGNLGGAQAIYEFRPGNRFYGAARFDWKEGNVHGGGTHRSILYFDGQERLGYTFGEEKWRFTLFTGFGFHYLQQKFKNSVRLKYKEFYVPLGFLTSYEPRSWFAIGLDFSWMPQVFPTVNIAPIGGANWTLKDRINNFYVAVPFTFTLTQSGSFQIILNPFYEHWSDGRSTAKTSSGVPLGIPGNNYNFYGIDLNFAYCF